ncbi:MAG: hypothetical protein JWR17_1383 [Pseudomonas sp.]|jgi:hypothetical protein|uniref:hypothetical protein n=1 Tax=Pseudomonas sp. TaxID=306 RepID=UPI002620C7AF|nr:hypothetical protein [Pseudomonas sp.]MDB6048637.1 hypothetical protein [Pseudomonas sp.]
MSLLDDEQDIWDMFAASALTGLISRGAIEPVDAAELAADYASELMIQRAQRIQAEEDAADAS